MPHLCYLEFYAGVGGWTMALQEAVSNVRSSTNSDESTELQQPDADTIRATKGWTTECRAAFDHSDLCMSVYQHNFASIVVACDNNKMTNRSTSRSITSKIKIETLTLTDLIQYNADIWMMSPPCQPHTRQHNNQSNDIKDVRSNSFLHLCRLLNEMETSPEASPPSMVLLENVVGFESSNSCQVWIQTLLSCHYRIAQFHLQPTQVGVPNDRPRYYCVAVRNNSCPTDVGIAVGADTINKTTTDDSCEWMSKYFFNQTSMSPSNPEFHINTHTSLPELDVIPEDTIQYDCLPTLSSYLDSTINEIHHDDLNVDEALLKRPAAWCLDVVVPLSRRSSCFTSAYGKYAKGTGSVLLQHKTTGNIRNTVNGDNSSSSIENKYKMIPPEERQYDPNWASSMMEDECYLRYFSGSELKRLFGFTDAFTFPSTTTTKQQWKLIGNSLNVHLTSKMVELAFRTYFHLPHKKT